MTKRTLLRRSLVHHWKINLAVVAGVAIAVAVLAGALTVGVSVQASLRDLALQRLGKTDFVAQSSGFFREQLATEVRSIPLITFDGFVTDQANTHRASRVLVYAVDDRFWKFHGLDQLAGPSANDAFLSAALAAELEATRDQSVLLRIENTSAIPVESLFGSKDDVGRTIRLTVRRILSERELGEFSLNPRQGAVRAIFVPLRRIQTALGQPSMANAMLAAASATLRTGDDMARLIVERATLDDLGLRLRSLETERALSLESRTTLLADDRAATAADVAKRLGMKAQPVLTYLANSIRVGDREIPYSVVSGYDWHSALGQPGVNAIVLNTWAARELNAKIGDRVGLDYYVWETEGRLSTRTAEFALAAIVLMEGPAADRDLVPEYPGITDSDRLADWNPPFPIDLKRVRPVDEEYWKQYRATPKAFISFDAAQRLWRSRQGALTSLRIQPPEQLALAEAASRYAKELRAALDPMTLGFAVYGVRDQSLGAAGGTTDFSQYFTYFSMFLVVSALLLASMFFKLGIEQRVRDIGLLQAAGFDPGSIRKLFFAEAALLSLAGGIAGMAGAVAYGAAIMFGLRSWWIGAVGTTALTLHVDPGSLASGAGAGVAVALLSIWWSLRAIARIPPRRLLAGEFFARPALGQSRGRLRAAAVAFAVVGLMLLGTAVGGRLDRTGAFFGAGGTLMMSALCWAAVWLRRPPRATLRGHGGWQIWRLGFRNTTFRPARSVLCIALIASATFVIVAVEAFKRDDREAVRDPRSGLGAYSLLVESMLPIVYDLNGRAGQDSLNIPADTALEGVRFDRFRVRPGDDTSCLNLYRPTNPRILGASADFLKAGRFTFAQSLASTPEETQNPWLLLNRQLEDGAIPVITDANSMTYVLHMRLGDVFTLPGPSDRPVRLKLIGALSDSIFQGEFVMAESQFVRAFPEMAGYRFFLVDMAPERAPRVASILEERLADFGVDAAPAADRLAGFHRVEYTYLSTFQTLGGLGLLLGTLGLGAVLLRNVLERRRELAVLRALGYRKADFVTMVVAENVFLLVCGLVTGTCCALLAIAPALADRGGHLAVPAVGVLLCGVLAVGLLASIGATVVALRAPLLPALRTE